MIFATIFFQSHQHKWKATDGLGKTNFIKIPVCSLLDSFILKYCLLNLNSKGLA